MALTDNERAKQEDRAKRRSIEDTSKRWSDQQKMEAIQSYLALGNLALTARVLGIPEITLRVWKASDWWKDVVEDLKRQEKIVLSNRMKKLVEASHTIVAQRLESGDPILNQKTGEIIYKPVSMKDAHKVAVDLLDRQNILEKATNEDSGTPEGDDNKLEKLAERFAEMATKSIEKNFDKRRTIDVGAVEISQRDNDNAVHEERETRLQAGERIVQLEAGANQAPDGENNSTETS